MRVELIPRLEGVADEDPVAAATRYLDLHVPVTQWLVADTVEPIELLAVYYAPREGNLMGGDYTVYLLDSGVVVRVLRGQ